MRSYLYKAGTATGGALGTASPAIASGSSTAMTDSLNTLLPLIIEVLVVVIIFKMVADAMKKVK